MNEVGTLGSRFREGNELVGYGWLWLAYNWMYYKCSVLAGHKVR